MSTAPGNVQIPAELLNLDRTEDTIRRGEKIELAIDALRQSQKEVNPSQSREQAVKRCLKYWFNASFPIIKATLKAVVVHTLSNTISSANVSFQDIVLTPYTIPVTALVFLLQVLMVFEIALLIHRLYTTKAKRPQKSMRLWYFCLTSFVPSG
jgi:hypothetical protein